jgi:prolyl-tRNA synthetase
VVADLVRREIRSYRQLPRLIYHIQTKFRDDPRPRAGLMRVREFSMKDSYSLDADWEGLERQYRAHYQAYFNIFQRCGLPSMAVKADVGMMGGKLAHEFMYLTPVGEDTLVLCDHCGYSANRQIAVFQKPDAAPEELLPVEEVATPETKTIAELADFLSVTKSKTAKAVFMIASRPEGEEIVEKFVFAVIRGDMEVNETKLSNAVKAREMRPATDQEIISVGAVPGYASPIGVSGALIVVDEALTSSPNLVAGANKAGFHLKNVNYGRDFSADIVTDISAAQAGDACPDCGDSLKTVRGVEIGNIFQLGTHYSDALGSTFLDKDGQIRPVIMGSYGIGSGRLLACIAEEYNDENGLIWPITVAPYAVHLIVLPGKGQEQEIIAQADELFQALQAAGIEVLYDDRDDSPGVKFNDADLLGMPIRLTVSPRSLEAGGVEFKRRDQSEKRTIPLAAIIAEVQAEIKTLTAAIEALVVKVPYEG